MNDEGERHPDEAERHDEDVFVADQVDDAEFEDFDPPPGWPKTVGTLSIIFGAIAVTCGGIGMAWMFVSSGFIPAEMYEGASTPPPMPNDSAVMLGSGVLGLAYNMLLIVAGVLLLVRHASARMLHLVYGVLGVVGAIVGTYAQMEYQSQTEAWMQANPDTDYARMQGSSGQAFQLPLLVLGLLVSLAWPTFCLIWFGFVKTRHEDMTGVGVEEVI